MRLDWWLIGICSSRAFSGIIVMTYAAALPVLQQEWALSAAVAGSIASGYQISYAISLVVFSALADRIGPKPLFIRSLQAAAVSSIAFAIFARGYLSALILYILVALSLGGTYTTALMILADRYPVERRGMATGWFIASTSLGYALSLLISGIAIPIGGYKLSFMATCSGPLLALIMAWITLRKTRVSVVTRHKEQRFTKEVLGNKPAMLLIGSYTFHTYETLGMWAWTPAFLTACLAFGGTGGLNSAGQGAQITAAFHFTGLIASVSMGMLSDRLGRARVIIMMAGISTVCSFVFGWTIGWPFVIIVGIGLIYGFSSLGDSPVLSTALTEVVRPSYLGSAFGLRSLLGFSAGAVSPLIFGFILDLTNPLRAQQTYYSNWGWAFSILGVGGAIAVWAAYRFGRIQNR